MEATKVKSRRIFLSFYFALNTVQSQQSQETNEMEPLEEHRKLEDFVETHYCLTGAGQVLFRCHCQNPENCSEWQHHPDLDAAIVRVIHGLSATLSREEEEAMNRDFTYRFLTWSWLSVNMVWAFYCWTRNIDEARHSYYHKEHTIGQFIFCFLKDGTVVLFLVNLGCFAVWLLVTPSTI